MNKSLLFLATLMAALILGGCTSSGNKDEEEDVNPPAQERVWTPAQTAPEWKVDWTSNVQKPNWESPDPRDFENWMLLVVRIDDKLAAYGSQDDLMAVQIGGVMRAVASPAVEPQGQIGTRTKLPYAYFILKVLGNDSSDKQLNIKLAYYNAKLKQLFEVEGQEHFVAEIVYGVEEDFCIDFTPYCSKYPVNTALTVNLPEDITPATGDLLAVFVGDECRGVQEVQGNVVQMTAYGKQENENASLRYYNAIKGITTFEQTTRLSSSPTVVTLK